MASSFRNVTLLVYLTCIVLVNAQRQCLTTGKNTLTSNCLNRCDEACVWYAPDDTPCVSSIGSLCQHDFNCTVQCMPSLLMQEETKWIFFIRGPVSNRRPAAEIKALFQLDILPSVTYLYVSCCKRFSSS